MSNNIAFWAFVVGALVLAGVLAANSGQQDAQTNFYPAPEPGNNEEELSRAFTALHAIQEVIRHHQCKRGMGEALEATAPEDLAGTQKIHELVLAQSLVFPRKVHEQVFGHNPPNGSVLYKPTVIEEWLRGFIYSLTGATPPPYDARSWE